MTPQREQAEHLLTAGQRDQTAVRILRRDPESPVEITLFHAQQAAEKYIKAVLALRGIIFRRTHDLVELNELAIQNGITVPVDRELLMRLSPYAVEFRYLGVAAPEVAIEEAETAIQTLLIWVRQSMTDQP